MSFTFLGNLHRISRIDRRLPRNLRQTARIRMHVCNFVWGSVANENETSGEMCLRSKINRLHWCTVVQKKKTVPFVILLFL